MSEITQQARPRRRKERDLSKAIDLRPHDIWVLYGIPSSTLHQVCTHPDPEKRLPSTLIPGRRGRRGVRLVNHDELKAWLGKFRTGGKAA